MKGQRVQGRSREGTTREKQRTCPVTKKARNATFDLPASFACRARARMPDRIKFAYEIQ